MSLNKRRSARIVLVALTVLGALSLAACAPGGSGGQAASTGKATTDVAGAGKVTLNVVDYEPSTGPLGIALPTINALFEKKFPNVKVVRQTTDFSGWQTKSKLALSASSAPCVAEGGQGFSFDGPLVAAKLIRPLDDYAALYGWTKSFRPSLLNQIRFDPRGKKFGSGELFGLSPSGEITGWYYNKKLLAQIGGKVPATFDELQKLLSTAAAAGVQPILLGDVEKWPASHILSNIASANLPSSDVFNLVFGDPATKWSTPQWGNALGIMKKWVDAGYIQPGWAGLSNDDSNAKFAAGGSLLTVGGTWINSTLSDGLGDNLGWFITPNARNQPASATGALSGPFHVTTACKIPDVAAAYLNFLISKSAQALVAAQQAIPSNLPSATLRGAGANSTLEGFNGALASGTLTPYLDWTTVKTGDVLFGGIQEVLAGQLSASDLLKQLDAERDSVAAAK